MKPVTDPAILKRLEQQPGGQFTPITDDRLISELENALPPTPGRPTIRQFIQASAPMRLVQGTRDAIDAGAQILPRALAFATSAGGLAENPVSDMFAMEAGRVDDINRANEEEYQAARKAAGSDGWDVSRVVGNIVSPANVAAGSLVPIRAGMPIAQLARRGAGLGTMGGAMVPVEDTQHFAREKIKQLLVGGMSGAALTPAVSRLVEKASRFFRPPSVNVQQQQAINEEAERTVRTALEEAGQRVETVPQELFEQLRDQARIALQSGRQIDLPAQLRRNDFNALEMQPLLGQITRDPLQYASERNLRGIEGVGNEITEVLSAQARGLRNRVRQYSGGAGERADAGQQLIDALDDYDQAASRRISGLYQTARQSTQATENIKLQGFAQDAADIAERFGDKLPSGVRSALNSLGLFSGQQRRVFTLADSDRMLKVINDNVSADPAANRALTELRRSLARAVDESIPEEGNPFRPAVQAAAQRFRLHELIPALREAALNPQVNEDAFVRRYLLSGRPRDVTRMADLLRVEAPQAFALARAQIGAFLERAAFGQNLTGDKAFSPERFAGAIESLGTARLRPFFDPDEIAQIQRIARVGAYIGTEPAGSAVNRSNTASAAANILQRIMSGTPGLRTLGDVGAGVTNMASRAARARAALNAEVPSAQVPVSGRIADVLRLGAGPAAGAGVESLWDEIYRIPPVNIRGER